jgi:thiamine-phosphate pyrophosphorylase
VFRFLAITNRFLCKNRPLIQAVLEAVEGGVDGVLLREPGLEDHLLYTVALQFKKVLEPRKVPLLISHRVDVAMAVGAQGVHLATHSLPPRVVREMVGDTMILGFSAHSLEEVQEAKRQGVDYVTLSPIFPTRSKPLARPLGLEYLEDVVSRVDVPLLTLGGIGPREAGEVMKRGAYGVAVMSALWKGEPRVVAREIKERIEEKVRS